MTPRSTWGSVRRHVRRSLSALVLLLLLLPVFAAFEAHTINVRAHIENALAVDPQHIDFGVVFPQEELEAQFVVRLSESFMTQERATDVFYRLLLERKPIPGSGTAEAPEYYDDLRPYIEVTKTIEPDPDGMSFSDLGNRWLVDPNDPEGERLRDIEDVWRVDFYVPCIAGSIGQDYEGPVAPHEGDYGADVRIEVFGLSYGDILHKVMLGDRVVPTHTRVEWTCFIVVKNDFDYTMTDIVVSDRFGGSIGVGEECEVEFVYGSPGWTYEKTTTNSGLQDRITWTIDELAPADRGVLVLQVSTELNPAGKQEYSSPGEYEVNSGAVIKWSDESGVQHSTSTESLSVTAYEP